MTDVLRLQVKLFLDPPAPELSLFIPVFHGWIRDKALSELLIDVVDYQHVQHGPGVVLVGHESDYGIDQAEGRAGLVVTRKRRDGIPAISLSDSLRRALFAAHLLEQNQTFSGLLRFRTDEVQFRVMDRLRAPNNQASFARLKHQIETELSPFFPGTVNLSPAQDPKAQLTATLKSGQNASTAALLARLNETQA